MAPTSSSTGANRRLLVHRGEFPFALLKQGQESMQLAHLRNNANYMASNGLLDYLRLVSVLGRGIIVNALVAAPLLLLMSIGVALLNVVGWRFGVAFWLAVLVLVWALVSPVLVRLWQVWRVPNTILRGTDSTVRARDLYERSFGILLLLLALVTVVEAMAVSLDSFRFWTAEKGFDLRELGSLGTVVLAFFGAAGRVLGRLGGIRRTIFITIVGLLGIVLPIFAVMLIADYLVFTGPGRTAAFIVLGTGVVFWLVMASALGMGFFGGALRNRFAGVSVVVLLVTGGLLAFAVLHNDKVFVDQDEINRQLEGRDLFSDSGLLNQSGALTASEVEERRQQFLSLVEDLARQNPSTLSDLELFRALAINDAAAIDETIPLTLEAFGEDPDGEAALFIEEITSWLYGGSHFPGAVMIASDYISEFDTGTISTLSDADFEALDTEINNLGLRLNALSDLFAEATFGVESELDGRASLLFAALGYSPDRVQDEVNSISDTSFPMLSARYSDSLDTLQGDMGTLATLLTELRADAARQVVFSARYPALRAGAQDIRLEVLWASAIFVITSTILLLAYGWIAIDPNRTSLHSLYRDRLASAFLVGSDPTNPGTIRIEPDLDLAEICRYEAGSRAPYHLINCAVNLQASRTLSVRDRRSDFFIFSKRFTGSATTRYCRSETMEAVYPDMSLSSAMAISAAAAAPNMGRMTKPLLTAFMVIINARMGTWVPNPGKLEAWANSDDRASDFEQSFSFTDVLYEEGLDLQQRWSNYDGGMGRSIQGGLFGIAFSGGGIRSASLNLGITQMLVHRGIFAHADYMSTVSGGGYLGSAISMNMRSKGPIRASFAGTANVKRDDPHKVKVTITRPAEDHESRATVLQDCDYPPMVTLAIEDKQEVVEGQLLIKTGRTLPILTEFANQQAATSTRAMSEDQKKKAVRRGTFGVQFYWRIRPTALLAELVGRTHENARWVNVSDGGHIENLATIELLRRQCKYIIVGDAEMDAKHNFGGLAILKRTAAIELGAEIEINLDRLRPNTDGFCDRHWAIGRVRYSNGNTGYLLYLKSSLTNAEPEDVRGYRAANPTFPHESTADQFFDEGQFESYRRLGQQIASDAITLLDTDENDPVSFDDIATWFERMWETERDWAASMLV